MIGGNQHHSKEALEALQDSKLALQLVPVSELCKINGVGDIRCTHSVLFEGAHHFFAPSFH